MFIYGLTEIYDRRLSDLRSEYDPTEAFVPANLNRYSNYNAIKLRNKIIESGISYIDLRQEIGKHLNYSAQKWVDEYKRLWKKEGEDNENHSR